MTHDEGQALFTIPKTTDISLFGMYTFTIESEIQVPTDHTMSSTNTITAQ